MWFDNHKHSSTSSKTSRQSAAALPQPGPITDHTSQTPWEDMKRHLQSFDESLPACPCTSKARARIGQPKYQEQSINLNQVRQNATRHLPEEKCSQVLGLIESTLWFSGHRLACGLIITSTQALLVKKSQQSATALPQPGSITDHISQTPWEDMKRHLQPSDESLRACPCTSAAIYTYI